MESYKIKYINKDEVEKTLIFCGPFSLYDGINLNELYKKDPTNDRLKPFIGSESTTSSNLIFIDEYIHLDDTIETIKNKLILVFQKYLDKELAFEQLYLFSSYLEKVFVSEIYDTLTQNGKNELTKDILLSFLLNIIDFDTDSLDVKDVYTYDDLLALNINERTFQMNQTLGQRVILSDKPYHYTINPFDVISLNEHFVRHADNLISTNNKDCLLHYKFVEDSTIYLCLANDVLEFGQENSLNEKNMLKLYYPFLYEKDIFSLDDFYKKEMILIEESKKFIGPSFKEYNEKVDLFHNIYADRTKKLVFKEEGIKELEIILYPEYSFNLPLDIIFKLLHSSQQIPLIKYNPSKKQEKIYRLYCDKFTKTGKKIPMLNKNNILKYSKSLATSKKIGCLLYTEDQNMIECEFDNQANIIIKIKGKQSNNIGQLEKIIKENVNPLIKEVSSFLEQSGYKLRLFESLLDNNIEIIDLKYISYLSISKKLNLQSIIGCVSSVFNIINDDLKETIVMRYKRVNNFNKLESIEAYIVEMLNKNNYETNIIKGLMENFKLSEKESKEKIIELLESLQVVQNLNENKKLKIKNNPGFLTTIKKDDFSNNILIEVSNINNILYLQVLPIYIRGLLQISEGLTDVNIELCSSKKEIELNEHRELIASSEKSLPENISITIKADDITFDDIDEKGKSKNLIDMLYDDDSSDDDDGSDDEIDDGFGGGKDDEMERDITGLDLSNPNPFFKKMQDYDKKLFLSKDEGKYNAYSRSCPWNKRRQPVILTKEEKDYIDKKHPGSYDKSIKYGSTKEKEFYYICPRYWDLKRNVSLTEDEVKSGKFGEIIDQNSKYVKPGQNIFEFFDKTEHINKKDGSYKMHNPGFLKPDSHPDDVCVPCCFSDWNKPTQIKRRQQCSIPESKSSEETPSSMRADKVDIDDSGESTQPPESTPTPSLVGKEKFEDYIKGPEKFPIESNRIGYLPVELERFLNTENSKCYKSKTNRNLKANIACTLRKGVENNKKQSFVACITDAFCRTKEIPIMTIEEMKRFIIGNISVKDYISYFNGSLIEIFSPNKVNGWNAKKEKNIEKSKYVIDSFDNYKKYLMDPNIIIDHTYLWDVICSPNPKIFDSGINMIIIENPEDDITNNLKIICPSNHYATQLFNIAQPTLILYKKNDYYEPIYTIVYRKEKKNEYSYDVQPFFEFGQSTSNMRDLLIFVDNLYNKMCRPLESIAMEKTINGVVHEFKKNKILGDIVKILKKYDFDIEEQVVNYNLKVIGLLIKKGDLIGYIPTFPSSINYEYDYVSMDNMEKYPNYELTKLFLKQVSKITNLEILCLPDFKVVDDNLIVGIITETNQFVPIGEPSISREDDLSDINNYNYFKAEKEIYDSNSMDKERIEYMKKIKLEGEFYEIFRNTIRSLLDKFENKVIRNEIEAIIYSPTMLYKIKLEKINTLLKNMGTTYIEFINYNKQLLDKISRVAQCFALENCNTNNQCKLEKESNTCKLLIPSKNLLNNNSNEEAYYGLLADQLIRYNRIRDFFFQPKIFLSFTNVHYEINENEIILLHSILTSDYFDDLIPMVDSSYIQNTSFDMIEPIYSKPYTNNYEIKEISKKYITNCEIQEKSIFGKFKKFFVQYKEIIFNASNKKCTFDIIITILYDYQKKIYGYNELKNVLIDSYHKLIDKYGASIYKIFLNYKYKKEYKLLINKKLKLDDFINNETYYMTNMDVIFFSIHFKIPLLLMSSTSFFENKKPYLKSYETSHKFYIVKCPGFTDTHEKIPKYRLYVLEEDQSLLLEKKDFHSEIQKIVEDLEIFNLDESMERLTEVSVDKVKKIGSMTL